MNVIDLVGNNGVTLEYATIRANSAEQIRKILGKDNIVDADSEKKKIKMESEIIQKMKNGKELTPKELEFLKKNNPLFYRYAKIVEVKRKCIENQLQHCKSKEEARLIQDNAMSELNMQSTIAKMIANTAINAVEEFKKLDEFKKLPETNKEESKESDKSNNKNVTTKIVKETNDSNGNSTVTRVDGNQNVLENASSEYSLVETGKEAAAGAQGEVKNELEYVVSFGSYQEAYVNSSEVESLNILS